MSLSLREQSYIGVKGCYLPTDQGALLNKSKIGSRNSRVLSCLLIGVCAVGGLGCQKEQKGSLNFDNQGSNSIRNLELKVKKLEQIVKENIISSSKSDNRAPAGKIKSLTFRIGTADDRLRIYWEDGSKSDLPCTKEQFIWVCG